MRRNGRNVMQYYLNTADAAPNTLFGQDIAAVNSTGLQSLSQPMPGNGFAEIGGLTTAITPNGQVDGIVTIPGSLAPSTYINLRIDTTGEVAATNVLLFDTHNYNQGSCGCAGSDFATNAVKINGRCDTYSSFLQELCSKKYVFTSFRLRLISGSASALVSPIKIFRTNSTRSSQIEYIDPSLHESPYQQNAGILDIPLVGEAQLVDNYTGWVIEDVPAGVKMNMSLIVGLVI